MPGAVAAILTGAVSAVIGVGANFLGQADVVNQTPTTVVTSGALVTVSAALAYIARQFASGKLVHQSSAQVAKIVERDQELLEEAHERERRIEALIVRVLDQR